MAESTAPSQPSPDPRFGYQNIGPAGVSVAMLDKIAASVFDPTAGLLGLVKGLVMASFAAVYLVAREKSAAAQAQYDKQQYDVAHAAQQQQNIVGDPLSGEKKT